MTSIDEKEIWIHFLKALEEFQDLDNYNKRKSFLERYKSEMVILSTWLNKLMVTGGSANFAVDPPSHCDLCGSELLSNGLFIDSKTKGELWAFMCLSCFSEHGAGIGWGIGQLYKHIGETIDGDPKWLCIAGGNPDPEEN